MVFSTLKNAVYTTAAGVKHAPEKATKMWKLCDNVQNITDVLKEVKTPAVNTAHSLEKITSILAKLLEQFAAFLSPLFTAVEWLKSTWTSVSTAIVALLKDSYSKLDTMMRTMVFGLTGHGEGGSGGDGFGIAVLLAVLCVLALIYAVGPAVWHGFHSMWGVAVAGCASVVDRFFPDCWLSEWLRGVLNIQMFEPQSAIDPKRGPDPPSFSPDTITTLLAFLVGSVAVYFFGKQGMTPSEDRNPITSALKWSGDYSAKANHLFTFFRNVRSDVGGVFSWIIETLLSYTKYDLNILSTIDVLLNHDTVHNWMMSVDAACHPDGRLARFADPDHLVHLKSLQDVSVRIRAALTTRPLLPFLAVRIHKCMDKLDKELSDFVSHKGVGAKRAEPFLVQWYGEPGIGKTVGLEYFISDLLTLMKEPEHNRLYSLPRKDVFWSNYAHQTAVLIDDLGAIMDSAGHCDDIKQIIDLKSSQPVSLNMASLEEKGTHFTSRYIFCSANRPGPPPDCGLVTPAAFERRRDILVEVVATGEMVAEDPTAHLLFIVRDPTASPYTVIDGLEPMTYATFLTYAHNKCVNFFNKGKRMGSAHARAVVAEAQGCFDEVPMVPNGKIIAFPDEPEEEVKLPDCDGIIPSVVDDLILNSCKNAFYGRLSSSRPFKETNLDAYFSTLSESSLADWRDWRNSLLSEPLPSSQQAYWVSQLSADWRVTCLNYTHSLKFSEELLAGLHSPTSEEEFFKCLISEDEDAYDEIALMPPRTRFALALLVRSQQHIMAIMPKEEHDCSKESAWYTKLIEKVCAAFGRLPPWLRTILRCVATAMASAAAIVVIHKLLSIPAAFCGLSSDSPVVSTVEGGLIGSTVAHVGNISGDMKTTVSRSARQRFHKFVGHATVESDWFELAKRDPFLSTVLERNLAIINMGGSAVFRALFIDCDWVMTVKHAFQYQSPGAQIELVTRHARCHFTLDKRPSHYKELPDQDVVFLNLQAIDGIKKDLRKHFVKKNELMISRGSTACLVRPMLVPATTGRSENLDQTLTRVSVTSGQQESLSYGSGQYTFHTSRTVAFEYAGNNGDCGSLLMVPSLHNRQPLICGIHVAGYKEAYCAAGFIGSNAACVFYEDLVAHLPPVMLKVAQTDAWVDFHKMAQIKDGIPFSSEQVAFLGQVPASVAATVPFKTTLRSSPIAKAATDVLGPSKTAPAILSWKDKRLGDTTFDPYIKGVEKFNATAHNFDMPLAKEVFEHMKGVLLARLSEDCSRPFIPTLRDEKEVLNGVPGVEYLDPMDLSTAVGWPFSLEGKGTSKRSFVEGEPGYYMLKRDSSVYSAWCLLDSQIQEGEVPTLVTSECAKDERLPLEKIYDKPKTRLFTILPFHYNMLVRKYFLDFSATLMAKHNKVISKVGINPLGPEWTLLAEEFLKVSDSGFSADYSSFDGRAPVFIFQWFCELVDEFYGDEAGSHASKARQSLLLMASSHYTLCGDELFRVVGGMPSGFSLTVIFNSLLNEFYMRYAFAVLLKRPPACAMGFSHGDFDRIFIAVYGDDNLVAVPFDLSWYTLPAIAGVLGEINVIIKNGLDKNADVSISVTQPLQELTFLSRGFVRHGAGFFLAPLKWVSVTERLYWIRQGGGNTAAESLEDNVVSCMAEAFQHGPVVFRSLVNQLRKIFSQSSGCVMPVIEPYETHERKWLCAITGSEIKPSEFATMGEDVDYGEKISDWRGVTELFPDIYCMDMRAASKADAGVYGLVVNCSASTKFKHLMPVKGPESWRDLESKMWAFTLMAIQQEQTQRLTAGIVTKGVYFVSPTGDGMAVVCAGLFALATGRYTCSSILMRVRVATGCNVLQPYAGGAGAYLTSACGASKYGAQFGDLSGSVRGTCAADRLLTIGSCHVVCNMSNPWLFTGARNFCIGPNPSSIVNTSLSFVRSETAIHDLAQFIVAARRGEEKVFLVFDDFTPLHAQWVIDANALAGVPVNGADACALSAIAGNLFDNAAILMPGRAHLFKRTKDSFEETDVRSADVWVTNFDPMGKNWEDLLVMLRQFKVGDTFHCDTAYGACKVAVACCYLKDMLVSLPLIAVTVERFFGNPGGRAFAEAFLNILLWLDEPYEDYYSVKEVLRYVDAQYLKALLHIKVDDEAGDALDWTPNSSHVAESANFFLPRCRQQGYVVTKSTTSFTLCMLVALAAAKVHKIRCLPVEQDLTLHLVNPMFVVALQSFGYVHSL